MVAKVLLSITWLCLFCFPVRGDDSVNLEPEERQYKAEFTYSLIDALGPDLDYMRNFSGVGEATRFKSEILSTETEPDVQWYFDIFWDSGLGIGLTVSSLPSNVAKISGWAECGRVHVHGKKEAEIPFTRWPSTIVGRPFVVFFYRKPLRRIPQYQIYCKVDVSLWYKTNATDDAVASPTRNATDLVKPTEVPKTKDEVPAPKKMNSVQCRKELVRDTLTTIFLANGAVPRDVVLSVLTDYSFKLKCHSSILSSRMPFLKLPESEADENQPVVHDFSGELVPSQLEALVHFLYWGTMNNLGGNCEVLYGVARKFGFECLRVTCKDVLMSQIRNVSHPEESK